MPGPFAFLRVVVCPAVTPRVTAEPEPVLIRSPFGRVVPQPALPRIDLDHTGGFQPAQRLPDAVRCRMPVDGESIHGRPARVVVASVVRDPHQDELVSAAERR